MRTLLQSLCDISDSMPQSKRGRRMAMLASSRPADRFRQCSNKLGDPAANCPVVGSGPVANLAIGWSMAVEEQEVGDPIVAASDRNASFVHHWHASHGE